MKGSEFKRRIETLARKNGIATRWEESHGKGSHGRLYCGVRFTTLKDLKKEIGVGLLKAICKQLGIRKEDL